MKPRHLVFALLALAALSTAAWHSWKRARPQQIAPQQIHTTCFLGYTNGVVGPIASNYVTNSAKNSIVQQWYAAERNAALFTVTNGERMPIRLYPGGRFYTKGPEPLDETTYLLDVPSFNGFSLKPGQSVTFQVAVFPHLAPWRLLLFYERDEGPISLHNKLKDLSALLGARMRGVPAPLSPQPKKYQVYSDWITQ